MSDEDLLNEARRHWKKRFPKTVQFMERFLSRPAGNTERWCPQCERFHSPPVIEMDEADE